MSENREGRGLSPEVLKSLVIIEGGDNRGSGFVAKVNGIPFIVTNIHVLAGIREPVFRTLDGRRLEPQSYFGAVDHDIVIMRLEEAEHYLTFVENFLGSVSMGGSVRVTGNTQGAGVVTELRGRVMGIGPNRVEVDAAFLPGNSGSPILDGENDRVVGVAAYMQVFPELRLGDDGLERGRRAAPRRFGYRFDSVEEWYALDLATLHQQREALLAAHQRMMGIVALLAGEGNLAKQDEQLRPMVERFENNYARSRTQEDQIRIVSRFFSDLRDFSEREWEALERGTYYDFFRNSEYLEMSLKQQGAVRGQVHEVLEQASQEMRHLRRMVRR